MMGFPRILFGALDTFSLVGGIQQFNQRVLSNLTALSQEAAGPAPVMCVMRDTIEHIPNGLRAVIIPFGPHRLGFIREIAMRARNSDILFLGHLNLLPVGYLAKKINPRLVLVVFVHGDDAWNDPTYRRRRIYDSFLLRSVDRVSSVSRYTAEVMGAEFSLSPNKFTILPNAIDPLAELPVPVKRQQTLLAVTRLAVHDKAKNLDTVFRALGHLRSRWPELRLEIVGDGTLRPQLESLAETLGVRGMVTFLGQISHEALREAYARASVFVLPSSKEGFGIVYLEAWQFKLPVICASEGAPKEVVSNEIDGFVIEPHDDEALAWRIDKLLRHPELANRMGKAGHDKVMTRYLNEHFRHNLAGLIAEVTA